MRQRAISAGLCLAALAAAAGAQAPGSLGGGAPVDPAVAAANAERTIAQPALRDLDLMAGVAMLRRASAAPDDAKARADALVAEASKASAAGQSGVVRRRLAEAAALLLGQPWNADTAYARSLFLDVTELVADPAAPLHVHLTQVYPAEPAAGATLRLSLVTAPAGRGPVAPVPERTVRRLWSMPVPTGDLVAHNLPFDVDLTGIAGGAYALVAEVMRGDRLVAATRTPLRIVDGLAAAEREARAGVAQRRLGGDLAATILYPFDTAAAVNGWRRDIPDNLDFPAAIARARTLLAATGDGRDPLWQSTGDQKRAYRFDAGGEAMPYHLFVPSTWKPGARLPILLLLHGGGANEDSVFPATGRFAGITQRLAEQHGVIVVAPLGFRPSGGYGAVYGLTSPGRDGVRPSVPPAQTIPSLSEADTLAVLARVTKEYGADPARTYVMGNSMGGGGTWYLAAKYPAMFAAASPDASSLPFDGFDFARLRRMPIHIVVGALDEPLRQQLAHQATAALAGLRARADLVVVPDENHPNAWLAVLPATFDFLVRH